MFKTPLMYAIAILALLNVATFGLWRASVARAHRDAETIKNLTVERDFYKNQTFGAATRATDRANKANEASNADTQNLQTAPRDINGNITCDDKCLRARFGR